MRWHQDHSYLRRKVNITATSNTVNENANYCHKINNNTKRVQTKGFSKFADGTFTVYAWHS